MNAPLAVVFRSAHRTTHTRGLTSLFAGTSTRTSLLSCRTSFTRLMTTLKAPTSTALPAVPRPSASLIIVNARNEILLVHRNPKSSTFAGMHVFPGGNFDKQHDESLQATAVRETFEESGLLVASSSHGVDLTNTELNTARERIHSQKELFRDFLDKHSLSIDTACLLPFTQWITPTNVPRRFRTQFYLVFLNASSSTGFASGGKEDRLPTPDGGQEVIAARFMHPTDIISQHETHKIGLMPPQYYLITTLAEILRDRHTTSEQREKVRTLSSGAFGRMVINPRPLTGAPDGWAILTYEGDEERGGKKGRLHRSMLRFGPGKVVTDIILQRNFDIFSEIEEHLFTRDSKL